MTPGVYRVDAIASGDADPELYLYRLRPSRAAVDEIDYNDDVGGSGVDAGLDVVVDDVVDENGEPIRYPYIVEVGEFYGEAGQIQLLVQQR